jgi:hypothetical protein
MRGLRRAAPVVEVAAGERVLAWAQASDGPVAGTRDALYLPGGTRVPWQQVEAADWDLESTTLTVREVGTWGEPRPVHTVVLDEPALLLQLVRERVTSTVLMQRHVAVHGTRGVRIVARRAPSGRRELTWLLEYDAGIDPDDPLVERATQDALAAARAEVGD